MMTTAPRPQAQAAGLFFAAPVHFGAEDRCALTTETAHNLGAHLAAYGDLPRTGTTGLLERVERCGLTGRGGAHVPVATKWRAVLAAGTAPVIVANAAESEPDSRKDAALLELRPHLVIDGLVAAAATLGARECVLWLHDDDGAARAAVEAALRERWAAGNAEPAVRLVTARRHYLGGEKSAIVSALSGGPTLPTFRTIPISSAGVGGKPTLVQNAETLARVALVARGLPAESTVLTTVAVRHMLTVLEAPVRQSLAAVASRALGKRTASALLVGGYGGRWVPWAEVSATTPAAAMQRGAAVPLGAGILRALVAGECGLQVTADMAAFLADASARQCGPCQFGLPAIAESLALLVRDGRRSRAERHRLDRYLVQVSGRGACHHPDGAVALVSSAIRTFADDVAAHRKGRCLYRTDGGSR